MSVAAFSALLVILSGSANGLAATNAAEDDVFECSRPLRPCGEVVYLDRGPIFAGPRTVGIFSSAYGLCLGFSHPGNVGFRGCGGSWPPDDGEAAEVLSYSFASAEGVPSFTEFHGSLRRSVKRVDVRFRKDGAVKHRSADVRTFKGNRQDVLGLDRQAGVFFIAIRGCVRPATIRVTAYKEDGQLAGRARSSFVDDC